MRARRYANALQRFLAIADRAVGDGDQGVGQERGVFGQVRAVPIQALQRIEGGGGHTGDTERIEHIDGSEPLARMDCDTGVLTLRTNAEDRAVGSQQVGNDGPDALAGARGRDGDQVLLAGVSQKLAALAVLPADNQSVRPDQGADLIRVRPPGGAMHPQGACRT